MFKFGNVALGKYLIRTSISKDHLGSSMTPEFQVVDLTRYHNIVLEKPFRFESWEPYKVITPFKNFMIGSLAVSSAYLCYDYFSVYLNRVNLNINYLDNNNNMIANV